jgi:hypothetical protein
LLEFLVRRAISATIIMATTPKASQFVFLGRG